MKRYLKNILDKSVTSQDTYENANFCKPKNSRYQRLHNNLLKLIFQKRNKVPCALQSCILGLLYIMKSLVDKFTEQFLSLYLDDEEGYTRI